VNIGTRSIGFFQDAGLRRIRHDQPVFHLQPPSFQVCARTTGLGERLAAESSFAASAGIDVAQCAAATAHGDKNVRPLVGLWLQPLTWRALRSDRQRIVRR
jgi:hypothetical protein